MIKLYNGRIDEEIQTITLQVLYRATLRRVLEIVGAPGSPRKQDVNKALRIMEVRCKRQGECSLREWWRCRVSGDDFCQAMVTETGAES
jgi:hypothetical protein